MYRCRAQLDSGSEKCASRGREHWSTQYPLFQLPCSQLCDEEVFLDVLRRLKKAFWTPQRSDEHLAKSTAGSLRPLTSRKSLPSLSCYCQDEGCNLCVSPNASWASIASRLLYSEDQGAGLKESATSSVRRSLEAVWAMSCLPAGEGDGAMPAS